MGLMANVPTLSYVSWKELLITYQNVTYQIENSHTNKPYIYWDSNNPYILTTSNKKLDSRSGLFYLIFNESGKYTVIPNNDIEMNFSENPSRNAITNRIVGLSNETKDKFTTVQIDIDGIKFDVYDTDGKFSKFEQRVDMIDLEVKGVEKIYSDDPRLTEMRESFNEVLLSLQATLGLFSSDMNTYMEDNKLTTDEKNNINAYKTSLEEKKTELDNQLNIIVEYLNGLGGINQTKINEMNTAKDKLNIAISDLFTNIDTVCIDDIFTNTEMVTVVSYFGKTNLAINEYKNTVDYIFLGVGSLIEEVANITLEQDNITLEVKRVENHINTEISRIELNQSSIELEVRNEIEGLDSKITQTASSLTSTINNEVAGLNSKITQTANSLTTSFTNADKNLQSQITQNANEITSKVSSGDVGTIVKQNATSWGLSINGKLSGTNYNFDGTNFTIGKSDGSTTSYHAPGSSKWTHSDGSYTQANSSGFKKYVSSTGYTFHYYSYVGEVVMNSWDEVTIKLPSAISGKVGTNYTVMVAIRSYDFGDDWANVATQQICAYIKSKTSTSFNISSFKTGLDITNNTQVIDGTIAIQYTITG